MAKTKKEILKMNEKELYCYKWSEEIKKTFDSDCSSNCSNCSNCLDCLDCLDCSNCSNCLDCLDCSYCSNCSNCLDCSYCRNVKNLSYAICNVEMSREEYEKKIQELLKNE